MEGAEVVDWTDRTFGMHVGGKIEVRNKYPLRSADDLSPAYTPGVARVCSAIDDDPDKAFQYTIKRNTVAVVSDGTAVLGLGDIGPRAAMPVMEGKAMLFKEFAGVDAFPICLATKDPDEIVATVEAIAPGFGGINLEDICAPRCFEIEERLQAVARHPGLPRRPARHRRGHARRAAQRLPADRARHRRACARWSSGWAPPASRWRRSCGRPGVRDIVGCDSRGALHPGREDYADGSIAREALVRRRRRTRSGAPAARPT